MSQSMRTRDTAPCPICNKCDFEWGFVKERYCLYFVRGIRSWWTGAFSSGEELSSRSCRECGHVALFRENSNS